MPLRQLGFPLLWQGKGWPFSDGKARPVHGSCVFQALSLPLLLALAAGSWSHEQRALGRGGGSELSASGRGLGPALLWHSLPALPLPPASPVGIGLPIR